MIHTSNIKVSNGSASFVVELRAPDDGELDLPQLIWLHGWAQNRSAFLPFASFFAGQSSNYFVDLPGFGESPPPPFPWGTPEYGDAVAEWLQSLPIARRTIVGHSFGCRVALRLAAQHP